MKCTNSTKLFLYFIAILILIYFFNENNLKRNKGEIILITVLIACVLFILVNYICSINIKEQFINRMSNLFS